MTTSSAIPWLRENLLPKIVPIIKGNTKFLNILAQLGQEEILDCGKSVNWTVDYADNSSASEGAESADLPAAGAGSYAECTMPWKIYRAYFSVNDEMVKYEMNDPRRFTTAMEAERINAMRSVIKKIHTHTVGGGSTSQLWGISSTVATTGDYAGQTRGTNTWWTPRSSSNSGTPRALTADLLDGVYWELWNDLWQPDEDGTDMRVIMCTGNMIKKFDAIVDSDIVQRVEERGARQIGGHPYKYTFRDVPVVPMHCSGTHPLLNKIYFLDLRHWMVSYLLPDESNIKQVPSTKDEEKYQIKMHMALHCENLRLQGVLADIIE